MRLLTAALFGVLTMWAGPAHAYWVSDACTSQDDVRVTKHGRVTHYRGAGRHDREPRLSHAAWRGLSSDCAQAAHLGGACGCVAMKMVGLTDRRFWAVRAWQASFPRTAPHVGAAAIWPGRHVEIVSSVNSDGTVSTRGSVNFSRVPIGRLIFVEAH